MDFKNVQQFKEQCGYEIDGVWFPRVTRIVEIKAKPALYRFYAGLQNFAEGERVKKQSASEGTMIHETAEAILLGKNPEVNPGIAPSIHAFKKFLSEKEVHVDSGYIEHRLVNREHRYAGTLDAIVMIFGRVGILDIKTSQEIYRDYNLQTSAYMAAMKDIVSNLETRWILRIDQNRLCLYCGAILRSKGGREKIKIQWNNPFMKTCSHEWGELEGKIELQEFPYWQNDFSAFLGAKRLWEWENEKWLEKAGYLKT